MLLVSLLALALATAATAQTPGYGVEIDAEETAADTDDTGCATFEATVRNSGSAPAPPQHEISLQAETEDDGWMVDPTPPASIQLGPGDEEPVTFGLCAGDGTDEGAMGSVTLTATVEEDPGTEKPSASETFTATFQAGNETDDGGFDGNDTGEEIGGGNETGDSGDTPGPGAVLLVATLGTALAVLRRRRSDV